MSGNPRNKPCWCGSGKKYKHCHLRLESAEIVQPFEAEKQLRKKITRDICMASGRGFGECSGQIVNAHTISRAASLAQLAVAGHVYAIPVSFSELNKTGGVFRPARVGINKTSTFRGFCGFHDAEIFRCIDAMFPVIDSEFCTVAAYRAIAKELYLKKQLRMNEADFVQLEQGRTRSEQQSGRAFLKILDEGRSAAIRELQEDMGSLETCLLQKNYSSWSHLIVEVVRGPLPVLVSAPFQPSFLPDGFPLQNLGDLLYRAESVAFTGIASPSGGAYLLSHRQEDKLARQFVDAVGEIPSASILPYLTALAFEMAENIAISPVWWDSLDEGWQVRLVECINRGILPFGEQNNESFPMGFLDLPISGSFKTTRLN